VAVTLGSQAALEEATAAAIRAQLGYTVAQCRRTFDAQPYPVCGKVFVAVWGDGRRGNGERRPNLDMVFAVNVTLTVRAEQPFDRWVGQRDDMEARLNAIVACVHADATDFRIANAANDLAGFRRSGDTSRAATAAVGFCEGLCWEGTEAVQRCYADWFHADPESPAAAERNMGFAQTARFGRARRLRAALTAG
jgi:hypothetical protein